MTVHFVLARCTRDACTATIVAELDNSYCGGLSTAEVACRTSQSDLLGSEHDNISLFVSLCSSLFLYSTCDELLGDGIGGHFQQVCAMLG